MNEASLLVSPEMMNAPEHPLVDSLELPVTNWQQSPVAEIADQRKRDSASAHAGLRVPGMVKRIIPIDNTTSWEYWWCVPGRLLLQEDVKLLQSDFARVESILTKLIWLWGGNFIGADSSSEVNDWQQLLELVRENQPNPDVIDVDFFPLTVINDIEGNIAVEPAHWHIEFFQLEATDDGYKLQEPKKACGCQIWTGKPFLKHLDTGEAKIRYDLGISQPLDMTSPPWQVFPSIN